MSADYAQVARQYAKDVVDGRVLACRLVQCACRRHLDELQAQRKKSFRFRFDAAAAAKVCRFVELLPHVKGKWARGKQRLALEPWQVFVLACVWGWIRKSDGLRRFRRVYIEVPRKNGKSSFTAGAALYMLAADGEVGAEVYSGATTEKQAWEVFGPARLMALRTPEIQEAAGIEVNARNLHILETGSKFAPIIGKPGDGASPSMSITDEYHEHQTEEQYDTMLTGMGAREQPISWVITTAGSDTAGPCYALRTELVQVLEGTVENDELFGVIYTVDADDDWTSEDALRKANPNYDVSVSGEFLRQQIKDALTSPRKQATAKMKHLNLWVTARDPWMNMESWNGLARPDLLAEYEAEPCYVGLDLSSKIDLTATMFLFRRGGPGENEATYFATGRYYIPEARLDDPQNRHYQGWAEQGHLIVTDGDVIDYARIREDVMDADSKYQLVDLGFDPWGAAQLAQEFDDEGIQVTEVPQRTTHLSEPMKWIEAMVLAGRLFHDGNPCFTWMMGNVTAKVDANENVFPRKERPELKIDGPTALITAMSRAMLGEAESPYSAERGLLYV